MEEGRTASEDREREREREGQGWGEGVRKSERR